MSAVAGVSGVSTYGLRPSTRRLASLYWDKLNYTLRSYVSTDSHNTGERIPGDETGAQRLLDSEKKAHGTPKVSRSATPKSRVTQTRKQGTEPLRPSVPLLVHVYQPDPPAENCATHISTSTLASNPSHPFYIKIRRRLAAFDPKKFHWRVQVPMAVSNKAAIRNVLSKKVRGIVIKELSRRGLDRAGMTKEGVEAQALSGALTIFVTKEPMRALQSSEEDYEEATRRVLDKVMLRRPRARFSTR